VARQRRPVCEYRHAAGGRRPAALAAGDWPAGGVANTRALPAGGRDRGRVDVAKRSRTHARPPTHTAAPDTAGRRVVHGGPRGAGTGAPALTRTRTHATAEHCPRQRFGGGAFRVSRALPPGRP